MQLLFLKEIKIYMKKNICSDSVLKKPITRGPIRAKSSLANKQVSIMRKITESESN